MDFLNGCLQYDQEQRLSWQDLINHPYITSDPIEEAMRMDQSQSEPLHLSYSETHDQFVRNEFIKGGAGRLTKDNSIVLNVKNKQMFDEVYRETITKHFSKQIQKEAELKKPKEEEFSDLANSMGPKLYKEEIKKEEPDSQP